MPQHLEESMVTGRVADIVEVVVLAAGADAFLARGRGRIGARLQTGEDVLERDHAGVDEHQRRIVVRHQRRRRDDLMPVTPEIIEEGAADVVGRSHAGDVGEARRTRSEEHTSELQSLMRISYAVFCLKKKKDKKTTKKKLRITTQN